MNAIFGFFDGSFWQIFKADKTNDEWVNNLNGARVEVGKNSNGTARLAGTEVVVKDNGNVGIGTKTPSTALHVARQTGDAVLTIEADPDNTDEDANPSILFSQDGALQKGVVGLNSLTGSGYTGSIQNALYLETKDSQQIGDIQFVTGGNHDGSALGTARMTIFDSGEVSVNTTDRIASLTVQPKGTINAGDFSRAGLLVGTNSYGIAIDANEIFMKGGALSVGTYSSDPVYIKTNDVGRINIAANGDVLIPTKLGVGQVSAVYPFYVDGTARAIQFRSNTTTYADYVFEDYLEGESTIKPEYKFMSLEEVESYIKENKHLPGVTGIDELESDELGTYVDLSEISNQTLEKVEEVYLHTIEQNKQIKALEAENAELKNRLAKIEAAMGL